ncbi:uncharacterized protein LOC135118571 [Helicoverpa armigera]|uniref:uncharacterized protein LOC135118571 n=1 Tax=Helicoverpa armigera TaxID=29058 RepID=UPI0030833B82
MIERRMQCLRLFLERNHVPINIVGRNEIALSIKNVRKSLFYYNNLLDEFTTVDKHLQYLLMIQYLGNFPKLLVVIYALSSLVFEGTPVRPPLIFIAVSEAILTVLTLASAALVVEGIIWQVDKIKEILTAQLMRCSDESLRFELQTALQYVRLRPFRYTLCRAIPLDVNMLFTIISLCITYVIVGLQLTHFSQ